MAKILSQNIFIAGEYIKKAAPPTRDELLTRGTTQIRIKFALKSSFGVR
jgi:hypothetical protein